MYWASYWRAEQALRPAVVNRKVSGRTTMIIAPGMIGAQHIADNPKRYAGKSYPHWDGGWREGAPSLSKPQVSNFDLLDGMVLHIADRYPNVKAIVHVGHSAGGQLLSRYSFGTPVYDVLRERGIYVRYVISNPSSVLYFDRQRPDLVAGKGFVDYRSRTPVLAEGECKEFNTYKYGLDGMVPYMTRRPAAAMLASFRKREVFLFQGTSDIDPMADGLDRDCPGLLQGRFRLERGQRYYEYLGHFFGPEIYKNKFLVLARIVLEKTPHVLVAGEGVSALAQEMGVPWVPESYFYTYANNDIVAVSTTGLGEKHMVLRTSKEIASLMKYRGLSVQEAADNALKVQLVALGGSGGAIALDKNGNFATPYTEAGMYRGWVRADGVIEVRIYDR
jgi:hypothetical protein